MGPTGQHPSGGVRGAPGKTEQAVSAWPAVESGVLRIDRGLISFGSLVSSLGTSSDSPNLREKLVKMRSDMRLWVKTTSESLDEASSEDFCSKDDRTRKGLIVAQFTKLLGDYGDLEKSSLDIEARLGPIVTQVTVPPLTSSGKIRHLRPPPSTSSSVRHISGSAKFLEGFATIMEQKDQIRNVCLIDDIKEGSSIVSDLSAVASAQDCVMETRLSSAQYQMRTTSDIHMYCAVNNLEKKKTETFLINIVDSRTASPSEPLYVTDGVLAIIDSTVGVSLRTSTVLTQAILEGLRPVLAIDKVDEIFATTDGEGAYNLLFHLIREVNMCRQSIPGGFSFEPEQNNVTFAAGCKWAFTLANMAEFFCDELGLSHAKLTELLWGDHFYDTQSKKWSTMATPSPTCKRGFVQFCYEPIMEVLDHCLTGKKSNLMIIMDNYKVPRMEEWKKLRGKALAHSAMQSWLPSRRCLLQMMIFHVPSPADVQIDRLSNLYGGPVDDRYAAAIRGSDPQGPLILYVSSMVEILGRHIALGRIYSGTLSAGSKVRVIGPNYEHKRKDCYITEVNTVAALLGNKAVYVDSVPAGNMLAVILNERVSCLHGTLIDEESIDAYPIGGIKDKDYRLMPQCSVSQFFVLPYKVYKDLFHHQDGALRWFWDRYCKLKGGILGDDMGMGKTRQICAFMHGMLSSELINSAMIVVPRTLLEQWIKELNTIGIQCLVAKFLSPSVKKQKKSLSNVMKDGGIVVTTYGVFLKNQDVIMGSGSKSPWDYIFLDEGHKIKNPWTNISEALNSVSCAHKFIVTGTPFQNNMQEFFAVVDFACPGLLGSKDDFDEVFGLPIDKGKHKDAKHEQIEAAMVAFKKLHQVMGSNMLRRSKKLLQLQGLLKNKQEFAVWLKLVPHQAHQYRSLLKVRRSGTNESFAAVAVAANICNHPSILKSSSPNGPGATFTNHVINSDTFNADIIQSSCKVIFTVDLVSRLLKEGHKVLIFSQSREMLKIIKEALCNEMDERQILHMDGTTDPKKRIQLVKDFSAKTEKCGPPEDRESINQSGQDVQDDCFEEDASVDESAEDEDVDECLGDDDDDEDDYDYDGADDDEEDDEGHEDKQPIEDLKKEPLVFLMSTLVGGFGLNLVNASRVIIIDPAKNPSTDNQTVDRVFRLGQSKNVIIYRLITCDTVEENTYRNQVIKGEIASSIMEGRQCRRGIPKRIFRVLTLPRENFLVSRTHGELRKTYKKAFDEDMSKEIGLNQKMDVVSCVTNHSMLFSLDEDRAEVKEKMDQGLPREPTTSVSGGRGDASETYDNRWRDRRVVVSKHSGKSGAQNAG